MAYRYVIRNVERLKDAIKDQLYDIEKQLGVFTSHRPLRLLYDKVMWEIENYKVFEKVPDTKPAPCQHKFRDFSWYLEAELCKGDQYRYKIFEPYLCIHCGERKNVQLEGGTLLLQNGQTAEDAKNWLRKRYPELKERAIVEDAIHDELLVDREYLRIADSLRGNGEISKEIELKTGV